MSLNSNNIKYPRLFAVSSTLSLINEGIPSASSSKRFLELSQCPQLSLNHKSGDFRGNVLLPLSLTLDLPDNGTGQYLLSSSAPTDSGQLSTAENTEGLWQFTP